MRSYLQHAAVLALAALAACHSAAAPASPAAPAPAPIRDVATYRTGEAVVAAMHARYVRTWYKTLTFTQKTSRLMPDGTWNVQTWYEALRVPGELRIDFDPLSAGNGVLYAHDSAYGIRNGRALPAQASINPLLLLGFDVYGNPPARTSALLRHEGFDLNVVHEDAFQGRPMIVVGAPAGDLHRKQFWVDAERLLFVRSLEPARDTTKVQDVRFVNYERRGGAWLAPRVEIHTDGKLVFHEDYTDMRTDVPLDPALFDPARWKTAPHWMKH